MRDQTLPEWTTNPKELGTLLMLVDINEPPGYLKFYIPDLTYTQAVNKANSIRSCSQFKWVPYSVANTDDLIISCGTKAQLWNDR